MSVAAEPALMTVQQYRELPDCPGSIQELHWGKLVNFAHPKVGHLKLQYHLVDLLRPVVQNRGIVGSEVPFRALPEFEIRGADVAFVSAARWRAVADDDDLPGSPELVIEILSPYNTSAEMREKASLFLSTGCQEFWIVHPSRCEITVVYRDGSSRKFTRGETIPPALFQSELPVLDVFPEPPAEPVI